MSTVTTTSLNVWPLTLRAFWSGVYKIVVLFLPVLICFVPLL